MSEDTIKFVAVLAFTAALCEIFKSEWPAMLLLLFWFWSN